MDQETYARLRIPETDQEQDERLKRTMENIAAELEESALPARTSAELYARALHTIAREDYPEGPEAYDRHNFGALRALGVIAIEQI